MHRVAACVLLLASAAVCQAAGEYGATCSTSLDCGAKAPHCQTYLIDRSTLMRQQGDTSVKIDGITPKAYGFCSQCRSDCDCAPNEYCGIDSETALSVPSTPRLVDHDMAGEAAQKEFAAVNDAFAGMPLKGKCVPYGITKTEAQLKSIFDNELAQCVPSMKDEALSAQVDIGDSERQLIPVHSWYTGTDAAVGQFCGHIYDHALNKDKAFFEQVAGRKVDEGSDTSRALLKKDAAGGLLFNSPAVCSKAVKMEDGSHLMKCATPQADEITYQSNLFEFKFSVPVVGWVGSCELGGCRYCRDGSRQMCNANGGIPRTCYGGQWIATVSSEGPKKIEYRIEIAIFAIMAVLAILLIVQCINAVQMRGLNKAAAPPAPTSSTAPAAATLAAELTDLSAPQKLDAQAALTGIPDMGPAELGSA